MRLFDTFVEVFGVLSRNKLRSALSGLAVGWGMLVLVVLLGAGTGLRNKALSMFSDDAVNSIWVSAGKTTTQSDGFARSRQVTLDNADYEATKRADYSDKVTSRFFFLVPTFIRYKDRSSVYEIRSVHPDHQFLEKTLIDDGRFLNQMDVEKKRKVIVIGQQPKQYLFRGENPIGKWLIVNNTAFRVVGVFRDEGNENEDMKMYVPVSTAQQLNFGTRQVKRVMFTIPAGETRNAETLESQVRMDFAGRHDFSPTDRGALRVRNNQEEYESINKVFGAIRWFVFFVGLGTVVAGVIGVGNIMMISVRERFAEFGLRKAIGATPIRIVGAVLMESIFLTALSGYAGLITGVLLLELFALVPAIQSKLLNMTIDLNVAFGALGILVFFGVMAGLIPAYRAAKQNPVEALRSR